MTKSDVFYVTFSIFTPENKNKSNEDLHKLFREHPKFE